MIELMLIIIAVFFPTMLGLTWLFWEDRPRGLLSRESKAEREIKRQIRIQKLQQELCKTQIETERLEARRHAVLLGGEAIEDDGPHRRLMRKEIYR